jgi:division protein CdvB (Snf7/Vps24/ESCRT-III family)
LSDRNFDPEATRDVAGTDVLTIASAYDELSRAVVDAGENLDGGVSQEMGGVFTEYHLLLRNAVVETTANLERLSETLLQIAEDDELAEGEIVQELNALADGVEAAYTEQGYTPMTEGSDPAELAPAPSEYDNELGGSSGTRAEAQPVEEN